MSNREEWNAAYAKDGRAHKNKYPSERVVGWVLRNYPVGSCCLDVGCGWGNNLRFLLAEGYDAYGIDFAQSAIDGIRPEFGERVMCGSIEQTSWPDNHFDFIIDRCSIQHNPVDALPRIFKEIHRVLKPGGGIFSELRRAGDDGFIIAGPTFDQLQSALAPFANVQIDLMTRTEENMTKKFESYLIDARK